MQRLHGGVDAHGAATWDFSSNAHAAGPCPMACRAVQEADGRRYPDPAYTRVRAALAAWHGVAVDRVVLAASASEFIQRMTAWRWRVGDRQYWTPAHAYGDYAHAARVWGMQAVAQPEQAQLTWLCEPSSPLGQAEPYAQHVGKAWDAPSVVLDRAYEPLRLAGACSLQDQALERVWQLWSPNKALGLTGVRAAYAIAPLGAEHTVKALEALAPSWPIGAHGVAMLQSWMQPDTQEWLRSSLAELAAWKGALLALLRRQGWTCVPSDTPFFCARPPAPLHEQHLRAAGVKLRDATSFGLPGWWRLNAQSPQALAVLEAALCRQDAHSETLS